MSSQATRRATCGSCGEPWFGKVAYCPYCGTPSAGTPIRAAADPPAEDDMPSVADFTHATDLAPVAEFVPEVDAAPAVDRMPVVDFDLSRAADGGPPIEHAADGPATGTRRAGWKTMILAVAIVVLAGVVLAIGQFATPSGDRAGQQGMAPAPAGDAARSGKTQSSAAVAAPAPAPAPAPARAPAPAPAPAPPPPPALAVPNADVAPPAQQPPSPPPAPRRALCSVANEKAGLCRAQ